MEQFGIRRHAVEHALWAQTAIGGFTLENIYRELTKYYSIEQCARAKTIELEIERTLIQPNYSIIPIWQDAIAHFRVIISSDMYLDRSTLEEMLQQNGFAGYSAIYVSGEQNAMKADGELFRKVQHLEGQHHFLHIGDERNGDFFRAKQVGWDAILTTSIYTRSVHVVKNELPYYNAPRSISDDIVLNLVAHNWKTIHGYWKRTGCYILGPLLIGFCQWLHQECIERNIDRIVFLARDGYVIKAAYERLYPEEAGKVIYMHISRKAAITGIFQENLSVQDILRTVKIRRTETIESLLSRLGVDRTQIPQEQRNISVSRHDIYIGMYDGLLSSYLPIIRKNSKSQKKLLTQLTNTIFTGTHNAIVDVGWHGTIQNCIEQVLGSSITKGNVTGFYLGLEAPTASNKFAYLDGTTDFNIHSVPFIRGVIETFLTAPHPSVDGYELNNCGRVVPRYSTSKESEKTLRHILDLQNGALALVDQYRLLSTGLIIDEPLSCAFASSPLLHFSIEPSLYDAERFGSIEFNDIQNRPLIECGHFEESDWKAGYLKKMTKISSFSGVLTALNGLRDSLKKEQPK